MVNALKGLAGLAPRLLGRHISHRKLFHDLAARHDLVYFGRINKNEAEEHMVRGVTFSHRHTDDHCVIGNLNGHDVIMLERTDVISFPGRPDERYQWTILQVDLDESTHLPQTFIDARHYDSNFYNSLFTKFARLSPVDHYFEEGYDETFASRFNCYAPSDSADLLPLLLTPDVAAVMAHHFAHFDVEWFQDRLLIYLAKRQPNAHNLDLMLREGLWLADQLEANYRNLRHDQ